MEPIVVSKDGSNCPLRSDEGECSRPECGGCMVATPRERTPEEREAYDAQHARRMSHPCTAAMMDRTNSYLADVAWAADLNEIRRGELIDGKQLTRAEHEEAVKKMRERRRTHTYDYHLADDCPLRKGPITVKMEA